MTSRVQAAPAWRLWLRRHERTIAAGYLAAVALAVVLLLLPPTRHFTLGSLQSLSDRWDRRWERRLAEGERLVAAKKYQRAAVYLEQLARTIPAPSNEHALDAQHEQVLRLLAQSYEGLGKSSRTMAIYDRLVAFDPNNYYNVFLKGQAAQRMLSGWAIAAEARDAYAAALKIFPNHLPSLRGYIDYYSDRGEFHPIVDAYRAYLDAFLNSTVTVTVGDTTLFVPLPVDGRAHDVVITLPRPRAESITLRAEGYPVAIDEAAAMPLAVVGAARARKEIAISLAGIRRAGMTVAPHGAWLPAGDSASMTVPLPQGVALEQVRLVMRLFKPMDLPLWVIVARSFHNLLDEQGRDSADARTVVFPKEVDADAAMMRPWWSRSGLLGVGGLQ